MDSSMDNSVLATSSIDGRRYSSDDPISSTVTSSTDVSSSLMDSATEVSSGIERLENRLHEESGLRHRRGNCVNESAEFVPTNEVSPSDANSASGIKETTTGNSSMHQQRSTLSSEDRDAALKADDSGGAKPKIKEKETIPTDNSSSPHIDSTQGRLGSNPSDSKSNTAEATSEEPNTNAAFECNICLDVARDAVISMCGHLFCWPCLHTWLETRPNRQICPVCKAGIGKDKVVPLYGRDDSNPKDPREKPVPPRPKGQRPEPESTGGPTFGGFGGFGGGGGGNGFQMSFGIGSFPFGFFATNFNLGDGNHGHTHNHRMRGQGNEVAPEGSAQLEEEQFLHKVFLWVAFAFIFWLLIA